MISIHAPRTGSDWRRATKSTRPRYFNPRSPHGERRLSASRGVPAPTFQSTLPARGATLSVASSTTGAKFQSTLPARGATYLNEKNAVAIVISIHAPRTGSDETFRSAGRSTAPFQSTLPARGATRRAHARNGGKQFQSTLPARGAPPRGGRTRRRNGISIHAPRTGSDVSL